MGEMWRLGWISIGKEKRKAQIEEEMWNLIENGLWDLSEGYEVEDCDDQYRLVTRLEASKEIAKSNSLKNEQLEIRDDVDEDLAAQRESRPLISRNEESGAAV